MFLSKGYWYSLFYLDDISFYLSQLFGVSIDELLDVFEIIGFVKNVEKKPLLLRYGVRNIQCFNPRQFSWCSDVT